MTLNPEAACAARTPRRPADRRRPYPHSFEESPILTVPVFRLPANEPSKDGKDDGNDSA